MVFLNAPLEHVDNNPVVHGFAPPGTVAFRMQLCSKSLLYGLGIATHH